MPASRTRLAGDERLGLERVSAPPHGAGWGAVHESPNRRWILPGAGHVGWRSGAAELLVDELTAFRLEPGQPYQLRHEGPRSHLVLSRASGGTRAPACGWLLHPRELYRLRLALARVAAGAPVDEGERAVQAALAAARPLSGVRLPPAVDRARRFLAQAEGVAPRLAELGEAANASPWHLARLFGRHLGVAPHEYRTRLRLAQALAWLQQGERDLAGLAHDLGFASQSHFGAVFRREVGVTPAQARRELAGARI